MTWSAAEASDSITRSNVVTAYFGACASRFSPSALRERAPGAPEFPGASCRPHQEEPEACAPRARPR
jgi:hypothetical protein